MNPTYTVWNDVADTIIFKATLPPLQDEDSTCHTKHMSASCSEFFSHQRQCWSDSPIDWGYFCNTLEATLPPFKIETTHGIQQQYEYYQTSSAQQNQWLLQNAISTTSIGILLSLISTVISVWLIIPLK